MGSSNYEVALEKVKELIAQLMVDFAGLHGIVAFILATPKVLKFVEGLIQTVGPLTGKEKEDLVVAGLDDLIKVPVWLEPFDGTLIRIAIKGIIQAWNTKFGHDWFAKVTV